MRTRTLGCADFQLYAGVAVTVTNWRVALSRSLRFAVSPVVGDNGTTRLWPPMLSLINAARFAETRYRAESTSLGQYAVPELLRI